MPSRSTAATMSSVRERAYNFKIGQCGWILDNCIREDTLFHRMVVRVQGRLMIAYTPAYVTDTFYFFEVGDQDTIVAAYESGL
jgi:hypothetical protein